MKFSASPSKLGKKRANEVSRIIIMKNPSISLYEKYG